MAPAAIWETRYEFETRLGLPLAKGPNGTFDLSDQRETPRNGCAGDVESKKNGHEHLSKGFRPLPLASLSVRINPTKSPPLKHILYINM